jgi:uncharacterized protein (TIGR02246 family)
MPLLTIIATAALTFGAEAPGQDAGRRDADEEAIRSLASKAAESWFDGDGKAYAALFDEDADYVTFGGIHLKGRDQIALAHQRLFEGPLAGSRLSLEVKGVRFLGPDIALMHVEGGVVEAGQTELTPARNSLQTLVVRKQAGEWHVAACQVTRIMPSPPGPRNG